MVGDNPFSVSITEEFQLSFINGIWDISQLLLSNESLIHKTAQTLPYMNGFD